MMDPGPGFVLSLAGLSAAVTLFYYIKANHTERMARIERGLPEDSDRRSGSRYLAIKIGMLLAGAGVGLIFGLMLDITGHVPGEGVLYLAMMLLCGGLSLLASYFLVDALRRKG